MEGINFLSLQKLSCGVVAFYQLMKAELIESQCLLKQRVTWINVLVLCFLIS